MQGKTVKPAQPRVQPQGFAQYLNRWTLLGAALLCWLVYDSAGDWINWVELRTYSPSTEWTPLEIADPCERVALGMDYALAIDQEGDVYAWGMSDKGQLGFVVEPKKLGSTQQETPRKVPLPGKAKCIATGNYYVVALMEDGSIWHWGDIGPEYPGGWRAKNPHRSFTPKKFLDFPGVISVSVHWRGGMLLTDEGEVYEWGATGAGFAHVHEGPYRWEPEKVLIPEKVKWAVSSGGSNSAITESKTVYLWGGIGSISKYIDSDRYSTAPLKLKIDAPIVKVTSGSSYMNFLTAYGDVWSWGTDTRTFSDRRHDRFDKPTRIPGLAEIVDIERAFSFSDLALRKDGKLIGWGNPYFLMPARTTAAGAHPTIADMPFPVSKIYTRASERLVEDENGCLWATQRWAARLRLNYQNDLTAVGKRSRKFEQWLEANALKTFPRRGPFNRYGDFYRTPIFRPDGVQICKA